MAKQLKTVLPEIISSEQKGFLKGRYIGKTFYDLMNFLSKQTKLKLLLLIDFQKAFDCLEWSYIIQVLEKYNFGSDFIQWFNILYANASICVINNGFFSEFFRIHRSCRQGDPLSPYLFILCIEPLAMAIKNNSHIKGVTFRILNLKLGNMQMTLFCY